MLDLIIHNLIERTTFVEKSVELDDVSILGRESDYLVRGKGVAGIEAYRGTVFVRGPIETKHNYSGLAYERVGRHRCWYMSEEAAWRRQLGL